MLLFLFSILLLFFFDDIVVGVLVEVVNVAFAKIVVVCIFASRQLFPYLVAQEQGA